MHKSYYSTAVTIVHKSHNRAAVLMNGKEGRVLNTKQHNVRVACLHRKTIKSS